MCKKIHPRSRQAKEGFIYLIIVYNKRKTPPPRKTRGRRLRYGRRQPYRHHCPIVSSPSSLLSHWPHPPRCRIVIIVPSPSRCCGGLVVIVSPSSAHGGGVTLLLLPVSTPRAVARWGCCCHERMVSLLCHCRRSHPSHPRLLFVVPCPVVPCCPPIVLAIAHLLTL
jgi:hypothetical protein